MRRISRQLSAGWVRDHREVARCGKGGLGVELARAHASRAERGARVPPHHGGDLIAEAVGVERRDVWVDCARGSETADGHDCARATVDVEKVYEAVEWWLRRHPL